MNSFLRALLHPVAAIEFLTLLHIPFIKTDENNFSKCIPFFPVAGGVAGLITASLAAAGGLVNRETASLAAIAGYIIITRALHIDGFMDTVDGFFSRKPKDDILRIMKESTIGSFSAAALLIWGLSMFVFFKEISFGTHICVQVLSRAGILLTPLFTDYARESGTGKFFSENHSPLSALISLIISICICIIISPLTLFLIPSVLIIPFLTALWSKKMAGGFTGDTLGFTVEITNIVMYGTLCILIQRGVLINA